HALGIELATVFGRPERLLDGSESKRLAAMVRRRKAREPVARIVGEREFWSLSLRISADTLVPRPESETLVEAVLQLTDDRQAPLRVLDLGTGSGCLLLALMSELLEARGIGVDVCERVLAVADCNAERLGFSTRTEFQTGDWDSGLLPALKCSFDIIVSNPPYIASGEIDHLAPEVALFDPCRALDGGIDGLNCYNVLVAQIPLLLAADGLAALEIGAGQEIAVARIVHESGLQVIDIKDDLAGIPRCVTARHVA
ncbi:MAG: peptide chain release factor N(5)-glutamine methyltransferase, partial [Pseudomonadota bacterium]|nr:peptide chain release factor N(5)-glutamine methyltransferase [Pseudomonadota bacterium]